MNLIPVKYRCLSGSSLKVIALVSMTIDHVAYYVVGEQMGLGGSYFYEWMRSMGRMAFPIFCFLIVEGYLHTRSLKRYIISLLVTAVISEIPWYLLGNHDSHNVIFTLFLGLVAVHVISKVNDNRWLVLIAMTTTAGLAWLLNTDYSWNGVCLIVVFFLFRERKLLRVPFGFPFLMEYGVVGTVIGMMLPLGYNGCRGFIHGRYMKYLFYVYYPLHLMVIWLCLN